MSISVDSLTKHLFVSGMTGAGKSETSKRILSSLWREHRVPFLVIEPAKREYRNLLVEDGFEDMLVFTLGNEMEAPFRLNPLEVPEGVPVQTHIDLTRTLFRATFAGLYPPLPYLLEQALVETYQALGWDLVRDTGGCGHRIPTLQDLREQADRVAVRAGYGRELGQNVRAALSLRLNSLLVGGKGQMMDTQMSTSMEMMLSRPVVLELASIGDPEIVSFLIGALVVRLYEGWGFSSPKRALQEGLQHAVLIEEAHRLLSRPQRSDSIDSSSIQGHAVESLCRLLVEARAFGQGVIVVDQSPAKLHPDVLRSTNTKIVHRLVSEDDRKAVGAAMNMNEEQIRVLATLDVGEAALFPEAVDQPALVKINRSAWRGDRSDLSVREHMASFFASQEEGSTQAAEARRTQESPTMDGRIEAVTQRVQDLIATADLENLWEELARELESAVVDVTVWASLGADIAMRALALGLAVGERLGLSEGARREYRRQISHALLEDGSLQ